MRKILLTSIACVGLTACGSDDDEELKTEVGNPNDGINEDT